MKPGKIGEIGGGYFTVLITGSTADPATGVDINFPTGTPPVAEIIAAQYARAAAGAPDSYAVTDYTVKTVAPSGNDQIYLKDYNTVTVYDAAAYQEEDLLVIYCKLAPKGYTGSLHEA